MISRRSLLQHGATATAIAGLAVAAVECGPTEAPAAEHPDAGLIALGAEFDGLFKEYLRLSDLAYDEHLACRAANPRPKVKSLPNDHPYWARLDAYPTPFEDAARSTAASLDPIVERMWTMPATSVAGFAAKARTLRYTQGKYGDSTEPMTEWDWDDECLERFIRDIEGAAQGRAVS